MFIILFFVRVLYLLCSYGQARTFGTPSCSGGGSTESLCSSTADSACGHPPDLPDDGNLATPGPPHSADVSRSISRTNELILLPYLPHNQVFEFAY